MGAGQYWPTITTKKRCRTLKNLLKEKLHKGEFAIGTFVGLGRTNYEGVFDCTPFSTAQSIPSLLLMS